MLIFAVTQKAKIEGVMSGPTFGLLSMGAQPVGTASQFEGGGASNFVHIPPPPSVVVFIELPKRMLAIMTNQVTAEHIDIRRLCGCGFSSRCVRYLLLFNLGSENAFDALSM